MQEGEARPVLATKKDERARAKVATMACLERGIGTAEATVEMVVVDCPSVMVHL